MHQHAVWLRIDPETMTAIPDGFNYQKHQEAAREIEQAFGLEPVESVLVRGAGDLPDHEKSPRAERRPSDWESFRAKESGLRPEDIKAQVTRLWHEGESGLAFKAALEEAGFLLARGDRRDFCLIDPHGDEHSLARRISGVKAAEIRERLRDIPREELPSVAEGREWMRAHADGAPEPEPERDPHDGWREAPTGTPSDWVEAPVLYTPPDWVEAPIQYTPPDWVEAPILHTPEDWVEVPVCTSPDWLEPSAGQGEPAPAVTPSGWREAVPGQSSDQRAVHTSWEQLVQLTQDEGSGAPTHAKDAAPSTPDEEAALSAHIPPASEAKKSWVERVMESRPARAVRDLIDGYRHRDGPQFAAGLEETAGTVEDILAQGPRPSWGEQPAQGTQPTPETHAITHGPARDVATTQAVADGPSPAEEAPSAFARIIAADAGGAEPHPTGSHPSHGSHPSQEPPGNSASAFDALMTGRSSPAARPVEPEPDGMTPER